MRHEAALKLAVSSDNRADRPPATWIGHWKNQMGSSMELEVNGSEIKGSYTSANSGEGTGGPLVGALRGYVAGDLISFSVLWPGGSITAWTGQLVDDAAAPRIETLWHLVTDVPDPDEPTKLWTSTFTGADKFTR
ncbi:avidin/streptavidin family protein [Cupriavidus pauculus]|uniref:avidin/streptavidin family protein n=1 Tax=Cupriavidus pauculus TaxID=82633 RepID=UPI003CC7EB14